MESSEDPGKNDTGPKAEAVFAEFLRRRERGEDADFEALCAARPELAQALRILRSLGAPPGDAGKHQPDRTSAITVPLEVGPWLPGPESLQIGPYRLLEVLGEGGMGTVYLAEQKTPVHRRVALKVIKLGMDTKEVVARFEAERQAMALLDHPNISKIYDAGATADGRPYFAMEYVRGVPLIDYCDRNRLSLRERLEIFVQVCHGVQHAHHRGIIHRDLKPSNVLVACPDQEPVAKIIDFGVAKAIDRKLTEKTLYTGLGRTIGTPAYMSPEQAETTAEDVDHRSDVYSLGVILYELLVGELPLDWESLAKLAVDELLRRIREDDPPAPSVRWTRLSRERTTRLAERRRSKTGILSGELRGDLDWIAMKALEKDRRRRYGTAAELAADIERHLRSEPVLAGPPSALYRLGKFVRKNRGPVAAAAAIFGVLLAGAATSLLLWREAEDSARIARDSEGKARTSAFQAEERRKEAEKATSQAQRALTDVRWKANVASIAMATLAVERGDFDEARKHLEACPEQERGWEWRHLDLRCRAPAISPEGWAHRGDTGGIFSPDGLRFARWNSEGTVGIWDTRNGQMIAKAQWGRSSKYSRCVAFSTNGNRIAESTGARIVVSDATTLKPIATIGDGQVRKGSETRLLEFDPSGDRIAAGYGNGNVKVWDLKDRNPPLDLETDGAKSLTFSPEGASVMIGGDEGSVRFRDSRDGRPRLTLKSARTSQVRRLRFSPAGDHLLTGFADGSVGIWSTKTWKEELTINHGGFIRDFAFGFFGKITILSSDEVSVWSGKGERLSILKTNREGYALGPEGRRMSSAPGFMNLAFADSIEHRYENAPRKVPSVNIEGGRWADRVGLGLRNPLLPVPGIALDPDGCVFAIASGNAVHLYLKTGWHLGVLKGHEKEVSCLCFDPQGKRLAAGAKDGALRIWDTEEKSCLAAFKAHGGDVEDVSFAPEGARLASSGSDRTVRIWDARNGSPIAILEGHEGTHRILKVAFDPTGKLLCSGDMVGGLIVWEAESGVLLSRMRGPPGDGLSLCFTPDGRRIASLSGGEVRIWDAASGDFLLALQTGKRNQGHQFIRFASDTELTAVGTDCITAWRASPPVSEVPPAPLEGEAEPKPSLGHLHAIGKLSAAIAEGHPSTGGKPFVLEAREGPAHHLALLLSELSPSLAALLMERVEEDLARRTPKEAGRFAGQLKSRAKYLAAVMDETGSTPFMEEVGFCPSPWRLSMYGISGGIYFQDEGLAFSKRPLVPDDPKDTFILDPEGGLLAVSSNGRVAVWDLQARALLHQHETPAGAVRSLAFSRYGRRLAAGCDDGRVRVWDTRTGERLALLRAGTGDDPGDAQVSIAPDGGRVCTWIEDFLPAELSTGLARFFDVAAGAEISLLPQPSRSAVFSPDGLWIASVPGDGNDVHISSAGDGRRACVLRGHEGRVGQVRFSPDGRSVLTAADDGNARLWKIPEGSLHRTLRLSGKETRAGFGPLGKHVFTECRAEGKLVSQLWDPETGRELLRTGEILSDQCLSRDEKTVVLAPQGRGVLLDVAVLGVFLPDVPAVSPEADVPADVPARRFATAKETKQFREAVGTALKKASSPARKKEVKTLTKALGMEEGKPSTLPEDLKPEDLIKRLKSFRAGRQVLLADLRKAVCDSGFPPRSTSRPDMIPVAEAALDMDDEAVCREGILILAHMAHREALPALLKAARHRLDIVRYYAAIGLRFLGGEPDLRERVVDALREARKDPGEASFNVRLAAAHALVELGEEQDPAIFLEALRGSLNGRLKEVSVSLAAEALGKLGRKDTIALIIEGLEASKQGMTASCVEQLNKMTGALLKPSIAKWKAWLEENRAQLPEQIQ